MMQAQKRCHSILAISVVKSVGKESCVTSASKTASMVIATPHRATVSVPQAGEGTHVIKVPCVEHDFFSAASYSNPQNLKIIKEMVGPLGHLKRDLPG